MEWSFVYLVSEWSIRLVMLFYVPQKRTTAAARTWLLLIFLLPWPGLALYLVFGRIYLSRHRREMQRLASHYIRGFQDKAALIGGSRLSLVPDYLKAFSDLVTKLGDFRVSPGNRVELLPDYEGSIQRLIADIDGATRHVHLLYYIFEDDATGNRVAEALIRASRRGVNCLLLVDAVGSKKMLKKQAEGLRRENIEVIAMLQVGFFRSRRNAARFDLRNHRKIAVIDGTLGYVGSQNLVNPEFVPDHPNEELVARITGPAVSQLQAVFLTDYYVETGRVRNQPDHFPELDKEGDSALQLLPSGPGFQRENQQTSLISLLYAARRRVVLVTPYFVPDESFLQALRTATDRGVEVHVILSLHSNQFITNLAQKSYYDELLEAGIHIHLYRPRFLHAKHVTVDDEVAVIGSTNIDIRSFALNAEVSMLIYDRKVVEELSLIQEGYLVNSIHLRKEVWAKRTLGARTLHGMARLADSLL